MKSIRSLFILIIGMMVLTVTAKTTAKLEQKQKQNVELTMGLIPQVAVLQVVKVFPAIQSEIAVVKSLEIQKPFYVVSIDVGIYKQEAISNTIYTTFSKILDSNLQEQIWCPRSSQVYNYLKKKQEQIPRLS